MNNNPSNMSNEDLEKDMVERTKNAEANKAADNANTSEEAEVKPMEKKSMDMGVDYKRDEEQDLDELIHDQGKVDQGGNMPDPETLSFREGQ